MNVDLGSKVITADGEELGTIRKLILDASGREVKSVVVERGLLLTDAFELPLSTITQHQDGRATVTVTADQVDSLPRFDERRYADAPDDVVGPFGFPNGGIVWPVAAPIAAAPYGQGVYPVAPVVATDGENETSAAEPDERWEIERRVEQANAVIERGADVMTRDGEKVGEVDSIRFDPQTGHPTAFLVSRGFLFSEDVEIPAEAIGSVDDEVVYLKADKANVDLWSRDSTVLLF